MDWHSGYRHHFHPSFQHFLVLLRFLGFLVLHHLLHLRLVLVVRRIHFLVLHRFLVILVVRVVLVVRLVLVLLVILLLDLLVLVVLLDLVLQHFLGHHLGQLVLGLLHFLGLHQLLVLQHFLVVL